MSIVVTESGISMSINDEQPVNACSPILITEFGIITFVNDVQSPNALLSILVTESLIMTFVVFGKLPIILAALEQVLFIPESSQLTSIVPSASYNPATNCSFSLLEVCNLISTWKVPFQVPYKVTADLYNHQVNFLGYKTEDDFSSYLDIKDKLENEKTLTNSQKEIKKYYYTLFNMVAAGFFFIGKPNNDGHITIGTFDKCNNMYLKKIYQNIIFTFLMLERYLGFYPQITLQVYLCDYDRLISLRTNETKQGFDYARQKKTGCTKRDSFFKNLNIPQQYWNYIQVDYIYYPLREKYNL